MAAPLRLFFAFFLLSILGKGLGQCQLSDLKVDQTEVGERVNGEHEYEVVITLDCPCSMADAKVTCAGFNDDAEHDDPNIIRQAGGDTCLINDGQSILSSLNFIYHYKSQISFVPVSATIACS